MVVSFVIGGWILRVDSEGGGMLQGAFGVAKGTVGGWDAVVSELGESLQGEGL